MKYKKNRSIIILILTLIFFIYPTHIPAKASPKEALTVTAAGPIDIKSDSLEIDNKRSIVVFLGNVEAKRDDIIINCQKIELFYKNPPKENQGTEKIQTEVREIIATEKVSISTPDGGLATAEKAVYNQTDEQIILTGKPVIKQGSDFVEGSKITLFLKEDRSIVEGSEKNRARAVLFPKEEKR